MDSRLSGILVWMTVKWAILGILLSLAFIFLCIAIYMLYKFFKTKKHIEKHYGVQIVPDDVLV